MNIDLPAIPPPDEDAARAVRQRWDRKTKPPGSLGRLESLAAQVAAAQGTADVRVGPKAIVVMGADHGVVAEGVSAYPSVVTGQMLLNFAAGGAAINVLAKHVGARVVVVDMGLAHPVELPPSVLRHPLGPGTKNMTTHPAMTHAVAADAVTYGIALARDLARDGVTLLGLGEMGIGNTTSAAALTAALLSVSPEKVLGRGTGIDDQGFARKRVALEKSLALHRPNPADPFDVLARLGGFEIAGLVGVVLGAASCRVPVVTDGFIATAAALVATRLCPSARGYILASHRSAEPGHTLQLLALDLAPILEGQLRLGEGTGAALAMGLVDASLKLLNELATFESAGVTDKS